MHSNYRSQQDASEFYAGEREGKISFEIYVQSVVGSIDILDELLDEQIAKNKAQIFCAMLNKNVCVRKVESIGDEDEEHRKEEGLVEYYFDGEQVQTEWVN